MKPSRRFGLVALLLGVTWSLGAMWWWALRGMNDRVANAHLFTAGSLLLAAFILLMISAEL